MFGFTLPFSRYADGRLGAFIRQELKPLSEAHDTIFPLDNAILWIDYWENISHFNEDLLDRNPILALHLVQRRSGGKAQYKSNSPEIDHIFPRSELRKKRFNPSKIEHFANYWILAKGKNQNKSNTHPKKYFRDVSASDLKRALIQRNMLDYGKYSAFLRMRSKAILKIVGSALSLSENDFVRAKGRE